MMLIRVGHGIGAGLLVAGALVYGSHYAAGEIGQVMVGTDLGLETTYNRDQVLEHWLSVPQLQRGIHEARTAGLDATPVLREAGQRLGIALAPVVGALNLSEIVLSGPTELLDGPLADGDRRHAPEPDDGGEPRRPVPPDDHAGAGHRPARRGRSRPLRTTRGLVTERSAPSISSISLPTRVPSQRKEQP